MQRSNGEEMKINSQSSYRWSLSSHVRFAFEIYEFICISKTTTIKCARTHKINAHNQPDNNNIFGFQSEIYASMFSYTRLRNNRTARRVKKAANRGIVINEQIKIDLVINITHWPYLLCAFSAKMAKVSAV